MVFDHISVPDKEVRSGETGWMGLPLVSVNSLRLFLTIFLMIAVPCEFPVVWGGNRKGDNNEPHSL